MNTFASTARPALRVSSRKPVGGFCFVSCEALLTAWFAFKREIIELLDVRVWLACFELLARRCVALKGKFRHYRLEELQLLVGSSSPAAIRRSLKRLEGVGLLRWSERGPVLPHAELNLKDEHCFEIGELVRQVENVRRRIPFPRRLLRELVRERRPVLIATAFGHLIRGLYYRRGQCVSGGRCKASWLADTFEVDARNAKAARRALQARGWLVERRVSQMDLNRWGFAFIVPLETERSTGDLQSPPPTRRIGRQSPPPMINKKLLNGSKNQKPAERRPIGARVEQGKRAEPSLKRVDPVDLHEPRRTHALFRDAVRHGHVRATPADELRVFAAVEHAKVFGTKNPCGLLVWLVRGRHWDRINQRDEDRGRRAMRALEESEMSRRPKTPGSESATKGSAPGAARGGAPEAARQILAGTVLRNYPALAELSAALGAPSRVRLANP